MQCLVSQTHVRMCPCTCMRCTCTHDVGDFFICFRCLFMWSSILSGPPSSPSLRPLSYTCYSVVIEWEPPQDDGGGNVSYTCTISGPGDYNVTVPNCNSPFTIDNITVNTDYTVNVMATNCAGDETSSVPIRIVASGMRQLITSFC